MSQPSSRYEGLLLDTGTQEQIRASAAVVPWRRDPQGRLQVYWVRRAATMAFMGGWWAFPGGGLSRRDAQVEIRGKVQGAGAESQTCPSPGLDAAKLESLGPDLIPGLVACALRELYEETGLWLGQSGADEASIAQARRRLLAKEATLGEIAAELGSPADASELTFAGRWLTPPFVPKRFDNRFFLLHWPAERHLQPTPDGGELDRGEWIEPTQALKRWRSGEAMAAPPILHTLRVLAECGPESGLDRLIDTREADLGPMRRIEFLPDVILLPLRTPTLPPATHTNAFILGHSKAVLIDPAPHSPAEKKRLLACLDAAQEQGLSIEAIWLSHHHSDHIGATLDTQKHLDVPVLAHPETAKSLLAYGISTDGELIDGQRVPLGDITIKIHHTPGHTRGHLCFEIEEHRALIAADLVSTLSTIVIDPPDGDMSAYLDSLEHMAALDLRILLPSHGPVSLKPRALLKKTIHHRLEREAKVKQAHSRGLITPEAMVAEVYAEVPAFLHPVACRQIEAHLHRLRELGEVS